MSESQIPPPLDPSAIPQSFLDWVKLESPGPTQQRRVVKMVEDIIRNGFRKAGVDLLDVIQDVLMACLSFQHKREDWRAPFTVFIRNAAGNRVKREWHRRERCRRLFVSLEQVPVDSRGDEADGLDPGSSETPRDILLAKAEAREREFARRWYEKELNVIQQMPQSVYRDAMVFQVWAPDRYSFPELAKVFSADPLTFQQNYPRRCKEAYQATWESCYGHDSWQEYWGVWKQHCDDLEIIRRLNEGGLEA